MEAKAILVFFISAFFNSKKDASPAETPLSLQPFKYNLDIIYEDKDLIEINKSAGISMHPGPGNYDNTIVNALINYSGNNLSNVGN